MKCFEVEARMEQLISNDLDLSVAKELEAHIKRCSSCQMNLIDVRKIGFLLRDSLPILLPSAETDASVMNAFHRRHNHKRISIIQSALGWKPAFGTVVISKPAFALIAIAVLSSMGIAFQVGRLSAVDTTIPVIEPHASSSIDHRLRTQVVQIPITKVVKQFVYLKSRPQKKSGTTVERYSPPNSSTLNSSIAENGYMTQTSLKSFQPVPTIKFRVVKGVRDDEQ